MAPSFAISYLLALLCLFDMVVLLWLMGLLEWCVGQFNDLLDRTRLGLTMLCSCLVGIDASWTVGEQHSSGTTLYLIMQLFVVCNWLPVLASGMLSRRKLENPFCSKTSAEKGCLLVAGSIADRPFVFSRMSILAPVLQL